MDRFKLHSGLLSAEISLLGGELRSLQLGDTQLIWQGDPAYWNGSAPFLFPFCGRVKDGVYRWQNLQYPMTIHGFLPSAQMAVAGHTDDRLTLKLTDLVTGMSYTMTPKRIGDAANQVGLDEVKGMTLR